MRLSIPHLVAAGLLAFLAFAPVPADAQAWRTLNCAQGNGNGPCHPTQYKDANGNLQDVDATHGLPTQAPVGGGTANQGTPGSVTAGWPTTNGEPADTTGTFTNATQSGNVTTPSVDGYATAIITINGTFNTATATFLASDDAGTTFYPLACNRIDNSSAPELGYTGLTNTNRAWLCATQGFDEIRVLSSAVTSGTVNVRISQSAAPIQAPAQQAITPGTRTLVPLDVSTVTTGGTAVTALTAGHRTAGGYLANPKAATIDLCVNEQTTASGTTTGAQSGLYCIVPGGSYNLAPSTLAVSVITSDSTHPFAGYGMQ